MTVGRLQPFGNCPQSDDCHEDSGPTINKAIIITRHVGRKHPTTNQSNIKKLELMMMVIIVPIIIIIIIIGMSIPNTQSRPKNAGHAIPQGGTGEPPQPDPPADHTTPGRAEATHHHTTPQGGVGRNHWGGGRGGTAEPGSYMPARMYVSTAHACVSVCLSVCPSVMMSLSVCLYVCMYACMHACAVFTSE